jgi:hypothetical protein
MNTQRKFKLGILQENTRRSRNLHGMHQGENGLILICAGSSPTGGNTQSIGIRERRQSLHWLTSSRQVMPTMSPFSIRQ